MKLSELMLAVYLRGRSCQFGNPFTLSNKIICYDLNISEKTLRDLRARIQRKGVIMYDSGLGKSYTKYKMLDTVMIPKDIPKDIHRLSTEVPKRAPQRLP